MFVYLTFDDGPGAPFTGQVLDLLARFNAKGTFFVLGVNVQTMPEFTRRAALEGHSIANHTMSHTSLQGIDHEAFFNEVAAAQSIIDELVGCSPGQYTVPATSLRSDRLLYSRVCCRARVYSSACAGLCLHPRDSGWDLNVDEIVPDDRGSVLRSVPRQFICSNFRWFTERKSVAAREQVFAEVTDWWARRSNRYCAP